MKPLFILLSLMMCFPVLAAEPAPIDEPILKIYSPDKKENSRRAIRLGYQNFRQRLNTPQETLIDLKIAQFIQNSFQPFFDKLDHSSTLPPQQQTTAESELQEEFEELLIEFTQLLLKNQVRYTNSFFLEDYAALQEALDIVEEAVHRGHF